MKAANRAAGMLASAFMLTFAAGMAPAWSQTAPAATAPTGVAAVAVAPPGSTAPVAAVAVAPPGAPGAAPVAAVAVAPTGGTASQGTAAAAVVQGPGGTTVAAAGAVAVPNAAAQGTMATLDFEPTTAAFTVVKDTAVYVAPYDQAPEMYPLQPGIGIQATAESKDKSWIVAVTEDGQAAYLPVAALGPYQASAAASVPTLADTLTGHATVIDTATLAINGQQVPLFGLVGATGILADKLSDLVSRPGLNLTCVLRGQAYVCVMPDGSDLARLILFNGVARPSPDSSDDYRQQAAAAQAAHKGLWQ